MNIGRIRMSDRSDTTSILDDSYKSFKEMFEPVEEEGVEGVNERVLGPTEN